MNKFGIWCDVVKESDFFSKTQKPTRSIDNIFLGIIQCNNACDALQIAVSTIASNNNGKILHDEEAVLVSNHKNQTAVFCNFIAGEL